MSAKTYDELLAENALLLAQLEESNEVIEAIKSGQVDALIVNGTRGNELFTLKSADHTYRVFIESMTEGAVTVNHQGIILYCNSQFADMVGLPLSKVIGLYFGGFIAPLNKTHFAQLFERGWQEDVKGEVQLIRGEALIHIQLSLSMLQLDEGISLSIILTDLTGQKEIQQQLEWNNRKLEEANHALEISNTDLQQFASVASHDLQEPLRKIHLFASLINNNHSDQLNPNVRAYLDKILSSTNRMRALIIDILNYSRLSQDTEVFEITDLNKLLGELVEDFEILMQEKKATIVVQDNLPQPEVNPGQLRQVFQNLISNALKFSRREVTPEIRVYSRNVQSLPAVSAGESDASHCAICIADNGIGFEQKYAATIFALFQRLNSKDRYEGTGIGLSIAKKIMDKHSGRITVDSAEGQGSVFTLVLPLRRK